VALSENSADRDIPAILGEHTASGFGVFGKSDQGVGVHGENGGGNIGPDRGVGVWGESQNGFGVFGSSDNHRGVRGVSRISVGVNGINEAPSTNQPDRGCGVHGESINGYGVCGTSENFIGIRAVSVNDVGVVASGGRLAGLFDGVVEVTGDIRLQNADCAEDFDIVCIEKVEPGTVMVIDSEGALKPSNRPYDKRVAGVISGAGNYKPGLILDKQESSKNRMPIALMGKVYCKVDASYGAIEVGDLLTSSPTPGHAMRADDPLKAFGAVIGKALQGHKQGQGLVPILVCLQ
jgi:hypothetical protein